MDRLLALVSFAILPLCGMWHTASAETLGLLDNQRSPTAHDIMDIPSGLLIGAGISSIQHEGKWNINDGAESFLDYNFTDNVNTNFYGKYKEDIHLLKNIGLDSFRFSISWARLLPNGTSDYVNEDAIRFYNNVLDELEKRAIEPFVTIYHWDHPKTLQDAGGWLNDKMVDWFANYSRVVFEKFGDRVKYFGTINEPRIYCSDVVSSATSRGITRYKCHQNMLKAHALAYHIFDKEFRHLQNGLVGIIESCDAYYPYSKDEKDLEAAEVAHKFTCGWTAHPIFSEKGDYSEIMKTRIAERSKLQGYNESRLPELSREWIDKIKNSADFFGLNHYTSMITKPLNDSPLDWPNDEGIEYSFDPTWPQTQNKLFRIVPQGFGDILRKIKDKYNNIPVYVLENGVSIKNSIDDDFRIHFFHSYLKEMLVAITRDKCDVRMYSLWSFLDGFELGIEINSSYGLVQVNFDDTNRTRTPRKSALWFKAVLAARKLLSPDISLPQAAVQPKSSSATINRLL